MGQKPCLMGGRDAGRRVGGRSVCNRTSTSSATTANHCIGAFPTCPTHLNLGKVGQLGGGGLPHQQRIRLLAGCRRRAAQSLHRISIPCGTQGAHLRRRGLGQGAAGWRTEVRCEAADSRPVGHILAHGQRTEPACLFPVMPSVPHREVVHAAIHSLTQPHAGPRASPECPRCWHPEPSPPKSSAAAAPC